MNFIAKLVEGLQPGATEVPLVLIDAMGFDGWPGQYAISQYARGSSAASNHGMHSVYTFTFEMTFFFFCSC